MPNIPRQPKHSQMSNHTLLNSDPA
ncbi:hypothetical protein SBY92_002318 [Candida maltosa Xu316]